jgi:hypothetical protein
MKPKSRLPMWRRLWRAFLVGAVFFAPGGLGFLEFCVGVFAQPQRTKEIYPARAEFATKMRNKVELTRAVRGQGPSYPRGFTGWQPPSVVVPRPVANSRAPWFRGKIFGKIFASDAGGF